MIKKTRNQNSISGLMKIFTRNDKADFFPENRAAVAVTLNSTISSLSLISSNFSYLSLANLRLDFRKNVRFIISWFNDLLYTYLGVEKVEEAALHLSHSC